MDPQYRANVRLIGAILRRWMKDARNNQAELDSLSQWIDKSPEQTTEMINELVTETRGRRPGGHGGRPRKCSPS